VSNKNETLLRPWKSRLAPFLRTGEHPVSSAIRTCRSGKLHPLLRIQIYV